MHHHTIGLCTKPTNVMFNVSQHMTALTAKQVTLHDKQAWFIINIIDTVAQ